MNNEFLFMYFSKCLLMKYLSLLVLEWEVIDTHKNTHFNLPVSTRNTPTHTASTPAAQLLAVGVPKGVIVLRLRVRQWFYGKSRVSTHKKGRKLPVSTVSKVKFLNLYTKSVFILMDNDCLFFSNHFLKIISQVVHFVSLIVKYFWRRINNSQT